jgi:hypothetical protein
MSMDDDEGTVTGAAAEVIPDFEQGKVVTRFLHPDTGAVVMELVLDPETAREYAFAQTRASYDVDAHNALHN